MMSMYTMLHRLASASLQPCRVNDVQRKLTIGLGMAVILLCTVACGGSDGSLAKGGINMVVMSGQAMIQSGEGNTPIEEGQEVVVTAGDQIMAVETGVKLLLADGSLLYLNPGTDLQVVTFSADGTARLSQLKGRIEVEAASPLLTVEISTSFSASFVLKTMQFTAAPTVRNTSFRLWIDDDNAHLTVEAGKVKVTNDDREEEISAGSEVEAIPGGELIVPTTEAEPTAVVVATDDLTPTPAAIATATATPDYKLYPAPGLTGPADGSDFKGNETILLTWDTPTSLAEDEWYEVQLWKEGEEVPFTVVQRVKEGTWSVERKYYPGDYQWRILIMRGDKDRKEAELSPPSQTWRFSWLGPVVQQPSTAPTSPSVSGTTVELTVYLRGTNNADRFVARSGEHIDAGTIYNEGGTVYGDVAVRIGGTVYHFDQDPEPVGVEQLPDPYRLEVKFSDSLMAATEGMQPGFNSQKAQFWVGKLDCDSAAPSDKPYAIEMTLYAGGEARKHTEVSFLVANTPLCGDVGGGDEEGGSGGGTGGPPPRRD